MIGKIKYILILILVVNIDASAQNGSVMYFMNVPQNHLMNPAIRPSSSVYIGLPALSGINLNLSNNFVNFSDAILKGEHKDSLSFLNHNYNPDKFLAKIKDKNFIEFESTIQILGFGLSVGKDSYVFLDINDRFDGNIVLPGDLFRLALSRNEEYVGNKIDLSALRANMKYYHEVGLGFSRNFTDKLRIGIKGKLLFGVTGASIDNRSLGITVNEDFSHTFNTDMDINISGPVKVYKNSNNAIDSIALDKDRLKTSSGLKDFLTGKKNLGLGMDIGATYELTDRIVLSAAITDLGFITWGKDITTIKTNNRFELSSLTLTKVYDGSITVEELGKDIIDSLKNVFIVSNSKAPYTTYLPFGISIGGSYNVTRQFSMGLLSYSRIIGKQIREALTLSANINLGNVFSASLGYTAENRRYDNFGAGVAVRGGIAQFYLCADRIPLAWRKIKGERKTHDIFGNETGTSSYGIPVPAIWDTINLRLGMNLVFGNRTKEKNDKPMILVE